MYSAFPRQVLMRCIARVLVLPSGHVLTCRFRPNQLTLVSHDLSGRVYPWLSVGRFNVQRMEVRTASEPQAPSGGLGRTSTAAPQG